MAADHASDGLTLWGVTGLPEFRPGDDLAGALAEALAGSLVDGDVVVVTSKVLSKVEGRLVRVPADPEERDPHGAVFAGPDGLDVIRPVAALAHRLLRPGGAVALEHDDSHPAAVREVLAAAGFADVTTHDDLTGRPRVATARRS
jgi:hypothetical protein